jgi:hypothetical protein
MNSPLRPLFAVVCFVLSLSFAASPFFVEGFAGFDPNQFPIPQEDPPVQPAGYAFAIWGVIYGWLILGMGWGLIKALRDGGWHEMRLALSLSLAMGTGWLAVAVASPVWASVLIWAMLLSALAALFMSPMYDRVWAAYPVGLYAGWLSGASCVSLGLLMAGYGWLDQTTAALICVAFAAGLGTFVQAVLGRAPTYGLAVIWALVGVVVANWSGTFQAVAYVALAGAALVAVPTLAAFRRG